jgi:hypothetical protein
MSGERRKVMLMNERILILAVAMVCTAPLSGCLEPTAEKTSVTDAQALVDAMTFVKSKHGLCFGIGTVSRISTNGTSAMSNVAVSVDCKAVGL